MAKAHIPCLWQGELKSSLRQISTRLINSMFKQSFDCYCKFQRNSDNDMSIQIYQKSLKIYGYAICTLKLIKTHLFTLSRVITGTILITSKDLNAQQCGFVSNKIGLTSNIAEKSTEENNLMAADCTLLRKRLSGRIVHRNRSKRYSS